MDNQAQLLTVNEAASELRLGRSFVYAHLIASGALPTVRPGGKRAVRIRRSDLSDYVAKLASSSPPLDS